MTVRAKFYVTAIDHAPVPGDSVCALIRMSPVFGSYDDGDGEANASWSEHTPSGELSMVITNPDAIDKFSVGEAYYLDFTPAGRVPG